MKAGGVLSVTRGGFGRNAASGCEVAVKRRQLTPVSAAPRAIERNERHKSALDCRSPSLAAILQATAGCLLLRQASDRPLLGPRRTAPGRAASRRSYASEPQTPRADANGWRSYKDGNAAVAATDEG